MSIRSITTLADAARAAGDLRARFTLAHAVAVLDRQGAVLDLHPFHRAGATMDNAIGWADCVALNEPEVARFVLLSATDRATTPSEEDLALLRRAREVFVEWSIEVVDWVQADDDGFLSLAQTVDGGSAWAPGVT